MRLLCAPRNTSPLIHPLPLPEKHALIDEVHERSIESDFLLIVLKSLMLERPDLK